MSEKRQNPSPRLRRVYLARRFIAGLVFLASLLWGVVWWQNRPLGDPAQPDGPTQVAPLTVVDWTVRDARVSVAAYIPKGITEEQASQSILNIYEWSQSFYHPVTCGGETLDENCQVGRTTILLLTSEPVRLVSGREEEAYLVSARIELDQFFISQLLTRPPDSLQALLSWHSLAQNVGAGRFEDLDGQPYQPVLLEEDGQDVS